MKKQQKRNWSQYNQRLKRQASLEVYISDDLLQQGGRYCGPRKPGGVMLYSDGLVEACLLMREYFGLALRQTQGFMESVLQQMSATFPTPDYTTLCRRSKTLAVDLQPKLCRLRQGYVIAVDSTGLSLLSGDSWNRHKHHHKRGKHSWHKLHIVMDTASGEILACRDTPATFNDCQMLPSLLEDLPIMPIEAVCADMAYDTIDCRHAIARTKARQLIPPKATAVHSAALVSPKPEAICRILAERDDAIQYIQYHAVNGNDALARKQWKQLTGYHQRSLVETTMSRLKAHIGSGLTSQLPATKTTQCRIKCKLLNILNHA